ncbi:MAG: Ribosome bioproteinsis protein [Heterodermia speciosa]|uniref:Ribosome bioproteinsis protein n=1 Tax=Heterodermia speciosa TaxID=116794 RepID=A0A8H3FVB9_9LECA|nr:MAG: Ribosome bioproteinsis protein [Heterodermia speciosa]
MGEDFPMTIRSNLETWRTTLNIITEPDRSSTRGRLEYTDEKHDAKKFRYLTPTLDIRPEHLNNFPSLSSSSFHLLADPREAIDLIGSLLELRNASGISSRPLIIWEPRPSSCISSNLEYFYEAISMVDVFSPNHVELSACFGHSMLDIFDSRSVEDQAIRLFEAGFAGSRKGSIIIRAAEHGSLVVSHTTQPKWLPAFYQPISTGDGLSVPNPKIVDPTGAGNAYLGGFAIGLLGSSDLVTAAKYGTVAASFALEQIGLPILSYDHANGQELWMA